MNKRTISLIIFMLAATTLFSQSRMRDYGIET